MSQISVHVSGGQVEVWENPGPREPLRMSEREAGLALLSHAELLTSLADLVSQFDAAWTKQGISCLDVSRAHALVKRLKGGAA